MPYISLMTENCSKTAQKHNLSSSVEKLLSKVEEDQSIQSWDFFLPTPFIKKNLGRSFRLVASQHPIGYDDIIVIAFVACFARGGSGEYEKKFIKDPMQVCGKYLPDKDTLEAFIESRRESLPKPSPEPNETERQYLYTSFEQNQDSDIMVYESLDWVETMKIPRILEESTRLYDSLTELLDSTEKGARDTYENDRTNLSILYKYLPNNRSVFLISPVERTDSKLIDKLKSKYSEISESEEVSSEIILRKSRRSYPSYILADERMWKSIEKNDVGNIALSPEELLILKNVRSGVNEKLFPLFINGRPGSGKSTILQYLFASHIFSYFMQEESERLAFPPLYLTYSRNLLEAARKNIDDILRCNSEFAIRSIEPTQESQTSIFDKCYGVFHEFLRDLLPIEKRSIFSKEKEVDFPIFRNLWDSQRLRNPKNEIRNLTSELAWHVLRSYIKGMRYDFETDFSVESYVELPNKQQTVTTETFKMVYNSVWDSWYKPFCKDNCYWDTQDLVFAVLNEPKLELSNYPAIFCDEAQDFSKLELDLILRLSLYSQRTLSRHELKRVPFAFAGDPFQTLNPTGFEWDSLQANFHEKIVSALDKSLTGKLEFNYQELSYNYRSNRFIVGLCNLIQLLRGILFDQKGLIPQRTWFDSELSMPVLFNLSDPLCEENLREQTELVIILPCQEGEEQDYVKNDAFLNGLAENEGDLRNFLSPMSAKGLEFSRVVLYKFGSVCTTQYPNLLDPLMTRQCHTGNLDASLPLRYFMNRLYVAASRAKARLIIVDDEMGIQTLWNNDSIKSLDELLKFYPNAKKLGWDTSLINYVQEGTANNWTQDRDDPLVLAEDFHRAGLIEKDPYKLRLAESNYTRCNQPANAKLCKAERYELENRFSKAAKTYLEIGKTEKALECYWESGAFAEIAHSNHFDDTAEQRAAIYHLGSHSENESERFLQFLLDQLSQDKSYKISLDSQWKKVFDECLDSITKLSEANFEKIYLLVGAITSKHFSPSDKTKHAELAFLANEFEHAVTLWESSNSNVKDKENYCIAKASVSPYPSNLIWLNSLGDSNQIVDSWKQNQNTDLVDNYIPIIANALLKLKDVDSLVKFLKRYPKLEILKTAYQKISVDFSKENQEELGKLLIRNITKKGNWKDAVSLVGDKSLSKNIRSGFSREFCYEIVQSYEFSQTTIENKNAVAVLLKELFIDSIWENIVPMRIVGAAIEKAYKIIYALEFYEGVWKTKKIPANKEDIDYATARWVKSKLRLADFLENEGKRGAKHRNEAENVCRTLLGINKERIPDEPEFYLDKVTKKGVDIVTVPEKIHKGIIALYQVGYEPKEIAERFDVEVKIVENVIANL